MQWMDQWMDGWMDGQKGAQTAFSVLFFSFRYVVPPVQMSHRCRRTIQVIKFLYSISHARKPIHPYTHTHKPCSKASAASSSNPSLWPPISKRVEKCSFLFFGSFFSCPSCLAVPPSCSITKPTSSKRAPFKVHSRLLCWLGLIFGLGDFPRTIRLSLSRLLLRGRPF